MSDRVLSGMRPTGNLHLGNYLGALANWVRFLAHMLATLEPIRERRQAFAEKPDRIVEIIHEGSRRARVVAQETMAEVRSLVKLAP